MMGAQRDCQIFWARVQTLADTMDDPSSTIQDLKAHLLAVDEGFSHAFDPADQYEEYVAVQFCRGLRRRLERIVPG